MAKAKLAPILEELRGELGDQVVFKRDRGGRIIVSRKPDFGPNRRFSPSQQAHQSRFRQAAAYAKRAAREVPIYAELAQGTAQSAYNVALGDWFNPPVVHEIDLGGFTGWPGGTVRARVTEDVQVVRVQVAVHTDGGETLEEGEAQAQGGGWYAYETTALCPPGGVVVTVAAEDLPGHEGSAEAAWER